MNCFFSDEVSGTLDFLKNKNIAEKLKKAEIVVNYDNFGLVAYVSEIEKRRIKESAGKKISLCNVDFAKENIPNVESFFNSYDGFEQYIFVLNFDFDKAIPSSATALSEREINALSLFDSSFFSLKKMVEFENSLKNYADRYNIKVIRYTNIYGPQIRCGKEIDNILSEVLSCGSVTLSKDDFHSFVSLSYISSVLKDIYGVAANGKSGNIYNGNSSVVSLADIKNNIYKSFGENDITLNFSDCVEQKSGYRTMSCRKIEGICGAYNVDLYDSLFKTLIEYEGKYIRDYVKKCYEGKIDVIRKKELLLLAEVDRICKKYDICYYLVGGSLLGAVRNSGFIPWDDDVDICMLREDYEKFRKVSPKELSEEFAYQSYRDESSTHYIYDKIRLKGTYFSSEHSGRYDDMENGIFLDVFVFDKTSNHKLFQKLHVFMIVMLRRLIHIRWTKEPVKGKFALVSSLILPLVCLFPHSFYHIAFEKILRLFERSKKSRFLLDGTGLYIKKGAFPLEWADESTNVRFEGCDFPGVKNSEGYLKRWYGENYMLPPEISKRTSGHKISRLDLGNYLFDSSVKSELSLNGELYDR